MNGVHSDSVLMNHPEYVDAKDSALAMIRHPLTDNNLMFRAHSVFVVCIVRNIRLSYLHNSGCVSPVGAVLKILARRANVLCLHRMQIHLFKQSVPVGRRYVVLFNIYKRNATNAMP